LGVFGGWWVCWVCLRIWGVAFFLYLTITESLLAAACGRAPASGNLAEAKQGSKASVIIDNFVFIVLSIVGLA